MNILLILVVLFLLFLLFGGIGGGFVYGPGAGWGAMHYGGGGFGLVIFIVLIVILFS